MRDEFRANNASGKFIVSAKSNELIICARKISRYFFRLFNWPFFTEFFDIAQKVLFS